MLTQQSIRDFLAQSDYDIRESGNGRWIDQKCTADVVTVIADFIYDYASNHPDSAFSSANIWFSDYASQTVEAVFKKPNTKNSNARHEYDKFFQQPMEMFANAKILSKAKQGRRNIYRVNRLDLLEYIALRERNALTFLNLYIEKVLQDSGLFPVFDAFFQSPTEERIFPKSLYPEISFYLENIIALTPTQHLNYAHPNGRTQEINEQYQHLLLLSKADRIRENLSSASVEHIYEFSNLLFVLSTGFEEDTPLSIADMDFCAVVNAINRHYA